jgi:hypothetical protein
VWEALAAIGSILSALVIAVTVVMAARQVKITTDQLEQTRRAAQFDAARTVLLELVEPKFVIAYRFIINELPALMQDPDFYHGIGQIGLSDDEVHREIYVLRSLDRIGTYVKFGLVDGEIIYSTYRTRIVSSWELLADVIAIHRKIAGDRFWEGAEFLYDDCKRWLHDHHYDLDTAGALRKMTDFTRSALPPSAGGATS